MAFFVDDNGNITLVQGDSGELVISNLPTNKNYTIYLAIQDEKRKPIGKEIFVPTNKQSSVRFVFLPELTDLLTVKQSEETAEYYYGVKLCHSDTNLEDTLLIGNSVIGGMNTITVYPKKVEGD